MILTLKSNVCQKCIKYVSNSILTQIWHLKTYLLKTKIKEVSKLCQIGLFPVKMHISKLCQQGCKSEKSKFPENVLIRSTSRSFNNTKFHKIKEFSLKFPEFGKFPENLLPVSNIDLEFVLPIWICQICESWLYFQYLTLILQHSSPSEVVILRIITKDVGRKKIVSLVHKMGLSSDDIDQITKDHGQDFNKRLFTLNAMIKWRETEGASFEELMAIMDENGMTRNADILDEELVSDKRKYWFSGTILWICKNCCDLQQFFWKIKI